MPLSYKTTEGDMLTVAASLLQPDEPAELSKMGTTAQDKKRSWKCRFPDGRRFIPEIPFLLETADLLFINKPAGISVHGDNSIAELLTGIFSAASFGQSQPESLSFKQGPLHRLDKDTTGILCFSRTLAGAQWFSQCLREKTVTKYYLGIVRGNMSSQLISTETGNGNALTKSFQVEYNNTIDASLMLFQLITGKKHQIRVHTMGAGHPLIGDGRYRGGSPLPHCQHYLLHAWRISFPESRPAAIPLFIEAPFFPAMQRCLTDFFPAWKKQIEALLPLKFR